MDELDELENVDRIVPCEFKFNEGCTHIYFKRLNNDTGAWIASNVGITSNERYLATASWIPSLRKSDDRSQ